MDTETRDRLARLQDCERAVIDLLDPDCVITAERRARFADLLDVIHELREQVIAGAARP